MAVYYFNNLIEKLESTLRWNSHQGYERIDHYRGEIEALKTFAENTKNAKEAGDVNEKYFVDYNVGQPSEQSYAILDMVYMIDNPESWGIDCMPEQQSLWLKPDVVTFHNLLTDASIALLHEAFDKSLELHKSVAQMKSAYPDYKTYVYDPSTPTQQSMLDNLYKTLLKGTDTFYIKNIVLKRDIIIPGNINLLGLNIQASNMNKTYTYAALIAAWPSIDSSISSIIPNTGLYLYSRASSATLSNNKISVTQEWSWSESIDSWLYPSAS